MTVRILPIAIAAVAVAACGGDVTTSGSPGAPSAVLAPGSSADGVSALSARGKVDICHRTEGEPPYVVLSVAEPAVAAHLAHGDGRVGDAVPGQPGMMFDASCMRVSARRVVAATGSFDGTTYWLTTFTVEAAGPVDATMSVASNYPLMRLALLGYNPQASSSPCSTEWLAAPMPFGPAMSPPTVSAHWDLVPPGSYCLNVVNVIPGPPYPEPYSWSGTITYP